MAETGQSSGAGAGLLSPASRGGRLVVRVHNSVARSPLRWLCGTRPVLALIHPFVEMSVADVLTVCHAVAARTDHWWVEGGWGVDALLGRQTRKHRDLDLCTSDDEREIRAVVAALRDLGLHVLNDRRSPAPAVARMIWLADGDGHSVEVYPVNLEAPPFHVAEGGEPAFVTGIVGDEQVPCVAGWLHVKAKHRGYRWRSSDRHDLRMLDAPGAQPAGGGPTS